MSASIEAIDKARSHPIRRRILLAIAESDDRPLSATSFARTVGCKVPRIRYHFNVLAEAGLIVVVKERPVRGSVEYLFGRGESFTPLVLDAAALDRITEILAAAPAPAELSKAETDEIRAILRATGRPVE